MDNPTVETKPIEPAPAHKPRFAKHPWKGKHFAKKRLCKTSGCKRSAAYGLEFCSECGFNPRNPNSLSQRINNGERS